MKPLTLIAIALWLSSCITLEEMAENDRLYIAGVVRCNIENFVWENTREVARQTLMGNLNPSGQYWHKTQC